MLAVKRNVGLILVLCSIASLICFGIAGIGRGGGEGFDFGFDFAVLYAAGRTWLEGANPYNHNELSRIAAGIEGIGSLEGFGFFYPPQSAAFFVTTALFSLPVAKVVWLGFNLLSIAAIVALTVSSINQHQQKKRDNIGPWLMAAVAIGNPFTTHIVWMGQTSLVAFAATMAAWFFSGKNKSVLAGICLGLASFKPQMCALLGIWFLLEQNWKIIAVSLGTACVLSLYPIFSQGFIGMLLAWYEGIQSDYHSLMFNQPGFPGLVGLQSLLVSAGFSLPNLSILGVFSVVFLWKFSKKINNEDVLGILMAITFTFLGNAHDYDYVGLLPLLTSLWIYASGDRRLLIKMSPFIVLLIFPKRLVKLLGVPVLIHWRTIVVIILVIAVVGLSFRNKKFKEKRSKNVS